MHHLNIGGQVYKQTRPTGSTAEDCVITVMAEGVGKHLQNGRLFVKIFYKDIFAGNTYYENMVRGQQLELQLFDFCQVLLQMSIVQFRIQTRRIRTVPMPPDTTQEHYALLTIDYQY